MTDLFKLVRMRHTFEVIDNTSGLTIAMFRNAELAEKCYEAWVAHGKPASREALSLGFRMTQPQPFFTVYGTLDTYLIVDQRTGEIIDTVPHSAWSYDDTVRAARIAAEAAKQ